LNKRGTIPYSRPATVFKLKTQPDPLISNDDLKNLVAFKASEKKDDPERYQGLHGPYEELHLAKTGKLPADYYEDSDPEPWGLRLAESRSNILWQVTSGLMDSYPEFGAAYMGLALDHGLGMKEYARELENLHKDWRGYIEHSGIFRDHKHSVMGKHYHAVSCPACSVLTALASQNSQMTALFKDMAALKPSERMDFLKDKGLLPYLNMMIPETAPTPKDP